MPQAGQLLASDLPLVVRGEALEGAAWVALWRPEDRVGAPLLVGSFSAVDVAVYDLSSSSPGVPIYHATPLVADVVLAALATTADWQTDGIGYTVRYVFDPALIGPGVGVIGGREYLLVVTLTTVPSATLSSAPKVCKAYVSVRGVPA